MRNRRLILLRSFPVITTLALLAGLTSCASNASPAPDSTSRDKGSHTAATLEGADFEWSTELGADSRVEVYGIVGTIQVEPASGSQLKVLGKKTGRGDLDSVEVRVVEAGDKVVICAVYPGGRCEADGYHGNHEGSVDVEVDMALSLPAGVDLGAKTVNGSIAARGVTGELEVDTVNGNIELSTRGKTHARTVNGSIVADVEGELAESVGLKTVNGTVRLELPAGVDANVEAATVNGNIKSDFPLDYSGRMVGGHAKGTLGEGGPGVKLNTVNGSIRIREIGKA